MPLEAIVSNKARGLTKQGLYSSNERTRSYLLKMYVSIKEPERFESVKRHIFKQVNIDFLDLLRAK